MPSHPPPHHPLPLISPRPVVNAGVHSVPHDLVRSSCIHDVVKLNRQVVVNCNVDGVDVEISANDLSLCLLSRALSLSRARTRSVLSLSLLLSSLTLSPALPLLRVLSRSLSIGLCRSLALSPFLSLLRVRVLAPRPFLTDTYPGEGVDVDHFCRCFRCDCARTHAASTDICMRAWMHARVDACIHECA